MGSNGEDDKTEFSSEETSETDKKVTPRLKRLLILLGAVVGLFIFWQTVIFNHVLLPIEEPTYSIKSGNLVYAQYEPQGSYVNSSGNIINNSLVFQDGDWIYYSIGLMIITFIKYVTMEAKNSN